MCLGAGARARNEARQNEYDRAVAEREADAYGKITVAGAKNVSYKLALNNSALELANVYSSADKELNKAHDTAIRNSEEYLINYLQDSASDKLLASGATGVSVARQEALDVANYMRKTSRDVSTITQNQFALKENLVDARNKAKTYEQKLFADVMYTQPFQREPAKPVKENVALAALTDGLKIASAVVPLLPGG